MSMYLFSNMTDAPITNRGQDCQSPESIAQLPSLTSRIDFLQGTISLRDPSQVLEIATRIAAHSPLGVRGADDLIIPAHHGLKAGIWWEYSSLPGPYGERFAWGNTGTEDMPNWKLWVSLPGSFLGALDARDQFRLFWFLRSGMPDRDGIPSFTFKCNRLDSALDDYCRRISPHEVDGLLSEYPAVLSHGKSHSGAFSAGADGQRYYTIYCGSKNSDCFLRIYDALPVHDTDCIRFEAQFRRNIANHAFSLLLEVDYDKFADDSTIDSILQQQCAALVIGSTDFRYPEDGVRLDRRERVPFWDSLCSDVSKAMKPSAVKTVNTFVDKMEWMIDAMAKLVYKMKSVLGPIRFQKYLDRLIENGRSRVEDDSVSLRQIALWRLQYGRMDSECIPSFL